MEIANHIDTALKLLAAAGIGALVCLFLAGVVYARQLLGDKGVFLASALSVSTSLT